MSEDVREFCVRDGHRTVTRFFRPTAELMQSIWRLAFYADRYGLQAADTHTEYAAIADMLDIDNPPPLGGGTKRKGK